MDIERRDVITLDGDIEYLVVSKIQYQNQTYYYLVEMNQNGQIKFCREKLENHSVIELEDRLLLKTLVPLFLADMKAHTTALEWKKIRAIRDQLKQYEKGF